jgi:hypothetical protein
MSYNFGYVLIQFSCVAATFLDVIFILFNNDNRRFVDIICAVQDIIFELST